MHDDRNEDKIWYDRGYSLGVVETKRDAVIPRLIGYGSVFCGALIDPLVTGAFLVMYMVFEILTWRDRRESAEFKREHNDPGPTWNWQEKDE